MRLIVDSGSSKIDWILISELETMRYQTVGYNPQNNQYFQEILVNFVSKLENPEVLKKIKEVHFYGSGVKDKNQIELLKSIFKISMINAVVFIESDLVGTARALLGDCKGVVAILGTGSVAAFYDGHKIILKSNSLGYVVSDEGGGVHIGKEILKRYINNDFDDEIIAFLKKEYPYNRSEILEFIYKNDAPNKWIAGLTKTISSLKDKKELENIISESFLAFIKWHLNYIPEAKEYGVNFVGSVGHGFAAILETVMTSEGYQIRSIQKSPMDGLITYHEKNKI